MTPGSAPRPLWLRWLVADVVAVIVFSGVLLCAQDATQALFDWSMFSLRGVAPPSYEPAAAHYLAFVNGVLGAVMIGWMATLLVVIRGPFARGEPDAWKAVAFGIATWFVLDSGLSLVCGYWTNVGLNVIFATSFAVPLIATRPRPEPA